MKYINLEYHPNDSRVKIADDDVCQSLTSRMGTGGGNVPIIITFTKSRRAKSKNDFETWKESEVSNTINTFDVGGVRATTVIVKQNESADSIGEQSESRNDNG